jgi:hypothetical protein
MKLIESKTLGTAQASIEFTSIPQDGTDLVLKLSLRTSQSSTFSQLIINFNTLNTNFSNRWLYGNGAGAGSWTQTTYIADINAANNTADTFSNTEIYIPNYAGSTNKSFSVDHVHEQNGTTAYQEIIAGLWSNTSAISGITLTSGSGNLVAGSIVSLYKITKGSDGIVTTS